MSNLNQSVVQNIINVEYEQSGASVNTDELGMREMQRRAYEQRFAQYLLIKAPPASGKSRALMFIGLDKLFNRVARRSLSRYRSAQSAHRLNQRI